MRAPYIKNDRPYVKKWWAGFFYIFVETATPNERQKSIFKTTTDFFLFVVVPKNNLGWLILKKNFVLIEFWCHNKNRYICVNNNNNKGGGGLQMKKFKTSENEQSHGSFFLRVGGLGETQFATAGYSLL